jgi:putative aldouronate transport system permease protein
MEYVDNLVKKRKVVSKKSSSDKFKRQLPLVLMLIPSVILVLIYSYGSMIGTVIAFQKFNMAKGLFGSEWVGLDNFKNLFTMPNIFPIIRNTVVIALGKMIGGIIVPVLFALMLNEVSKQRIKRVFQTMVYLPHFLSWVILASIFTDILSPSSGIVNRLLGLIGVEPVFFLGSTTWFPITMIITDIWKSFGFGSIIYLAALTGIDQNLYEAAEIDGAGRTMQTIHVTLPGIVSTIILMSVLSMGNILNGGFDQIYNMYSASVYGTGDILDTFVFRLGIENAQYALSTAANLFKSGVSLIFVTASYGLAYKFAGYRIF